MFHLSRKTVLVTGRARGIELAIAEACGGWTGDVNVGAACARFVLGSGGYAN